MKSLKEKFGKFEIKAQMLKEIKGGHCPASLKKPGGCEAYWGSDGSGLAACLSTCQPQE